MQPIRYLKLRDVDALRKNIRANLPWYRSEKGAVLSGGEIFMHEEMTKVFDWSCFALLDENSGEKDDKVNAVRVYKAIRNLSPQQAADERIWVYATHFGAAEYTAARWKIPDGADDDKAEKHIRMHYFGSGGRGLTRDNAISRLWWIAHAAARCDGDEGLENSLKFIMWDQEVRKNILERSLGMSTEILSGLVRVLERNWDSPETKAGDKSRPKTTYNRDNFRLFMRQVHRRGGRIMLNVLSKDQLDELLNEMFDKYALQGGS